MFSFERPNRGNRAATTNWKAVAGHVLHCWLLNGCFRCAYLNCFFLAIASLLLLKRRRPGGPLKNGVEGPNGSSAMESVRQNIPSSDGAEDTLDVSHRLNLRPAATSSPALRRRRHYLWRSHRRVEQSSFYAIMDQAGKSMAASSSTVPSCPRHFLCSSKHNSLFKAPAARETHETVEPQLNYQ